MWNDDLPDVLNTSLHPMHPSIFNAQRTYAPTIFVDTSSKGTLIGSLWSALVIVLYMAPAVSARLASAAQYTVSHAVLVLRFDVKKAQAQSKFARPFLWQVPEAHKPQS